MSGEGPEGPPAPPGTARQEQGTNRRPVSCSLNRDVKPDNILLDEQGERRLGEAGHGVGWAAASGPRDASSPLLAGHAHLTDFNIATIIKDGERATALAGTKPYMGEPRPLACCVRPRLGGGVGVTWVTSLQAQGCVGLGHRRIPPPTPGGGGTPRRSVGRGPGACGFGTLSCFSLLESSGNLPVLRQRWERLLLRGGLVVSGGAGLRAAAWMGMEQAVSPRGGPSPQGRMRLPPHPQGGSASAWRDTEQVQEG